MKIVLDTNVLLVSISSRSRYRPILDAFIAEEFEMCVTTEILLEYEEIISAHMGRRFAEGVLQLVENAPNVQLITRYYKWNLIRSDADDNKFVDCVIAGNASYLVTEDKHFDILQTIPFPKVRVLKAATFKDMVESKNKGYR